MTLYDYNKGLPDSIRYIILQRKLNNGIKLEGWEYDIDSTCIQKISPEPVSKIGTEYSITTSQFIILFIITLLFFAIWDMTTKK